MKRLKHRWGYNGRLHFGSFVFEWTIFKTWGKRGPTF